MVICHQSYPNTVTHCSSSRPPATGMEVFRRTSGIATSLGGGRVINAPDWMTPSTGDPFPFPKRSPLPTLLPGDKSPGSPKLCCRRIRNSPSWAVPEAFGSTPALRVEGDEAGAWKECSGVRVSGDGDVRLGAKAGSGEKSKRSPRVKAGGGGGSTEARLSRQRAETAAAWAGVANRPAAALRRAETGVARSRKKGDCPSLSALELFATAGIIVSRLSRRPRGRDIERVFKLKANAKPINPKLGFPLLHSL